MNGSTSRSPRAGSEARAAEAAATPKPAHQGSGTRVFLGGRFSQEEVERFGGIKAPSSELRSSNRIRSQPNSAATQMERAQQVLQAKNSNACTGISQFSKYSIKFIPHDVFVAKVNVLGASLGNSHDLVDETVNSMKEPDYDRTLIVLKKKEENIFLEKEKQRCVALERASNLSLDLGESEQQGSQDHKDLLLRDLIIPKNKKKKEKVLPLVVRRSGRLNKK